VHVAREAPFTSLQWSVAMSDVRECMTRVEALSAGTE
jgi:hypothetical protein